MLYFRDSVPYSCTNRLYAASYIPQRKSSISLTFLIAFTKWSKKNHFCVPVFNAWQAPKTFLPNTLHIQSFPRRLVSSRADQNWKMMFPCRNIQRSTYNVNRSEISGLCSLPHMTTTGGKNGKTCFTVFKWEACNIPASSLSVNRPDMDKTFCPFEMSTHTASSGRSVSIFFRNIFK